MATRVLGGPEGTAAAEAGPEASRTSGRLTRRRIILVLGGAFLLLVGVGVGWLVWGGGESSSPSYVIHDAVVQGPQLTSRQVEMLHVTRQYVAAWEAKDGNAVASFMVPDGYLELPTLGNRVVRAGDGSLQKWVETTGTIPNELTDPIVVDGNTVVLTGSVNPVPNWMMMLQFTDSGSVKIVSDTHWGY